MMSDILGEIVELNTGGYEIPKSPDSESMISSLQKTRERLLEVAAGRPDQIVFSRHLAVVNKRIGLVYMFQNRWAEARPFLHESAWLWERVVRHEPLDRHARRGQVLTLWDMAQLAEKEGKHDETIAILTRGRSGRGTQELPNWAHRRFACWPIFGEVWHKLWPLEATTREPGR